MLRYDGRSLVLFNRSPDATINIRNLTFVQKGEEDEIVFEAQEWGIGTGDLRAVRPGDCYQAWSVAWDDLPASEFPAEICASRQGFFQTPRAFWIAQEADAVFEVRRGSRVLAVCPAVEEDIEIEIRCLVEVRP